MTKIPVDHAYDAARAIMARLQAEEFSTGEGLIEAYCQGFRTGVATQRRTTPRCDVCNAPATEDNPLALGRCCGIETYYHAAGCPTTTVKLATV